VAAGERLFFGDDRLEEAAAHMSEVGKARGAAGAESR
jgi:hypothetical protein